jgi:hypothetical protein
MNGDLVHPALFRVISKCCEVDKAKRYQSTNQLEEAVIAAFDVILGRVAVDVAASARLTRIKSRLERESKYSIDEITTFVDEAHLATDTAQKTMCMAVGRRLLRAMATNPKLHDALRTFLPLYGAMVRDEQYPFEYAETIASEMDAVFSAPEAPPECRSECLDYAIRAADAMNRYAAMDKCVRMIHDMTGDDVLGSYVADVIRTHRATFLRDRLDPLACGNTVVSTAIVSIKR